MARDSYQKGRVEPRKSKHGEVYVLRYRLRQGGRWVEKTEVLRNLRGEPCKSDKEVQKAADRRMQQVNALNNKPATPDPEPKKPMIISEFIEGLWQHHTSKVKASTAYHYDLLVKRFILPEFGSRPLAEIDAEEITWFFEKREKQGLSTSYQLVIYQLLKNIFGLAQAYKKTPSNPVNSKLHRPTLERKEKPALTADEIRRVIQAVSEPYRPLFFCMALTGLRIGELLGLRWQNIDFAARRLTVTHTLWRNRLMPPKTDASKRSLHMPAMLCEVFQTHREASIWTAPDDFVFVRADGAPFDGNWLRIRVLFPALESVGIKRQKSAHGFHLFRHSAASIVHAETRDLSLAQKLLGHSRLSTTADIYTHTHGAAEEATETLAREIWGSCGLTVAESSMQVN